MPAARLRTLGPDAPPPEATLLVTTLHELAMQTELDGVIEVIRRRARPLVGADGVTFVLRDGDEVFYAEEDAIAPLWRGRRFPASACISGWVMLHDAVVTIDDIYLDARIPHDAYRPTFVKSLAMIPIRRGAPLGALGAYWARTHRASGRELMLLEALANAASIAVHNGELLREARAAAHARDEFLGSAAHELRTPLASAMLHVEAGERLARAANASEIVAKLGKARAAGRRLASLIDRLLEFATRLEGKQKLQFAPLDLQEVVEAVCERLAPIAEQSACSMRVTVSGRTAGVWSYEELDAILSNLLGNAIRYAPRSRIEVDVNGTDANFVLLSVSDHGPGIESRLRARVFQRYERGVSAIEQPGFGLGLAIVRDAVEQHDGTIAMEDTPGGGTTFRIKLPRARRPAQSLTASHKP